MNPIPEGLAAALSRSYRLERELGAGGMATVYLAEDLKHNRQVAIKVLRPDLAASLGAERFLREVGIAARLSHPHILGLFDSGEAGGFLYYVMPYVEGISLRQKLQREGELPIPETVRILRDIADALTHAHRQGVVHRDIKPENVMLVERHALVMDFGVAKALAEGKEDGSSSLTSAGVALGTPAYMAPEQASGEGHVDARADLYAWGVVAYELLVGQPPFVRATPQNTLAAQVTATPEPVSHHRANVPGALARLVMQCLEKKAADRPQTAEEVLRQLDQVLTPSGGMTPTDTRPYQTAASRRARQRTALIGTASVVALAVIGVLGWRWWKDRGVPLVKDLVLVAPLEAEGPAVAGLARDLAGLPTAISREGVGKAVPAATVRDLATGRTNSPVELADFLARRTGAGYVLRTSCAPQGNGAACQLELFRRPGNLLRMAVPVAGSAIDSAFSARLREQALAMLLLELYWGDQTSWLGEYITPSLEAVRALKKSNEGDGNLAALERVVRADSNWIFPLSQWTVTREDLAPGQADSIIADLSHRTGLTDRDRATLDLRQAWALNDREQLFQILQGLYQSWPSAWLVLFVRLAVATDRPSVALQAAMRADSLLAVQPRLYWIWHFSSHALHEAGRYKEQVALAARLRTGPGRGLRFGMRPEYSGFAESEATWTGLIQEIESQGYAGLGDVEAVRRVVAEMNVGTYARWPWVGTEHIEDLGLAAALELMAHGYPTEGEAMLAASLPQMRKLREEQGSFNLAENEVWSLEWTGHLEAARRLAEAVLRDPRVPYHNPELLGSLGKIAAREGRRADALAYSQELADSAQSARRAKDPGRTARYLYYRATIAARLGDRESAVQFLEQARALELDWFPGEYYWVHKDPDLASLRGYPRFESLFKPKN